MKLNKTIFFLFATILSIVFFSCKDSDTDSDSGKTTNQEEEPVRTNKWIHSQMDKYYLWNTQISKSPVLDNSDHESFFDSLLYRTKPNIDGDRFSWIEETSTNSQKLAASNKLGFDFILHYYYKTLEDDCTIGFYVVNVRENTDAAKQLKRGDIIHKINGTAVTRSNYSDMYRYLEELGSVKLSVYNKNGESVDLDIINSSNSYDPENPIWLNKIVEKDGIKVGYIVYNKFEKGKVDNKNSYIYDEKLTNIINDFYTKDKVKNIVIDLRYNPGGYVVSAVHLASALVPNRSKNNIFAISEYNSGYQKLLIKDHGENALNDYFAEKIGNTSTVIPKTNFDKVYIIATENSASASELTITGLRPYLGERLIHVGDVTVGKDKGAFTLEPNNKDINWALHPLVSRLRNTASNPQNGKDYNYVNGLEPDIMASEWVQNYNQIKILMDTETEKKVYIPVLSGGIKAWKDLGDKDEALLSKVFDHLQGRIRTKKSASDLPSTMVKLPDLHKVRNEQMLIIDPETKFN